MSSYAIKLGMVRATNHCVMLQLRYSVFAHSPVICLFNRQNVSPLLRRKSPARERIMIIRNTSSRPLSNILQSWYSHQVERKKINYLTSELQSQFKFFIFFHNVASRRNLLKIFNEKPCANTLAACYHNDNENVNTIIAWTSRGNAWYVYSKHMWAIRCVKINYLCGFN